MQTCTRCGANICETCRFKNPITALICLDCEANICTNCLNKTGSLKR